MSARPLHARVASPPRPAPVRSIALASTVLMMLGLLVATAMPAQSAPTNISGATLDWGVKESFRNYVVGPIAHGTISTSNGASQNADGTFRFTGGTGTFDDAGNLTTITFAGTVSFDGHDGALDFDLSNPRVELTGGQSVVRATMVSKDMTSGEVKTYDNVAVANLDVDSGTYAASGGTSDWTGIPATLSAAGAPAFAGFYAAGTALDALTFSYAGPGGEPVPVDETFAPQGQSSWANTSVLHSDFAGNGLEYDTDHDWIWTSSYNTGQVVAFDAETLAKTVNVTIPGQNPRKVVYSPANDRAYVVDTKVTVLGQNQAGDWAVLETLDVPGGGASNDITVNPLTGEVWLSWQQGTPSIRVFTLGADGTHTYRDIAYPEGSTPGAVLFSSAGHAVVIGTTYQAQQVPAFRIVGEAGSEAFEPIAGVLGGTGYSLLADGTLVQAAPDYTNYPVVLSGVNRWNLTADGYVAGEPILPFGLTPDVGAGQSSFNGDASLFTGVSTNRRELRMFVDGVPSAVRGFGTTISSNVVHDGTVYVLSANRYVHRLELAGYTPSFATNPSSTTLALRAGRTSGIVRFTASLTNLAEGTLQWQRKAPGSGRFVDVPGATDGTLQVTAGSDDAGAQFRATATNAQGKVVSGVATLDVTIAPQVDAQPQSLTVTEGALARFTVGFSGFPAPAVTWEREVNGFWQPIGANDLNFVTQENSLIVVETDVAQTGARVRATVQNRVGTVRSDAATLTVKAAGQVDPTQPVITTQPKSITVAQGADATLTVAAEGGQLGYTWQKQFGSFWFPIADATAPALTLDAATPEDAGSFRAVVSNAAGQATSQVATVAVADRFVDVPSAHTFATEIAWLAASGITTGYDDGTFRGSNAVLREQLAAFLHRYAGSPEVELPEASPFTDLVSSHAFFESIVWFDEQGITTGYADGTFRGDEPVLREQLAAFLYRVAGSPEVELPEASPFVDVPTTHTFYREIVWLSQQGITTGYADSTFRGSQPVLREQIAAFLYRFDRLA
ncbi:HtaA domain-containing protein [Aeromicrobium alkaliterrae]|uniref:Ig-like domain-containing protein n=1 Tax=Aeromicrobium alkaliterrae TaxID=302168 RepID=A0ABN2JGI9_9ACTN